MSRLQDDVVDALREGPATAREIAVRLGDDSADCTSRVCRACRSLLKFGMIDVAGTVRVGSFDARVYVLAERWKLFILDKRYTICNNGNCMQTSENEEHVVRTRENRRDASG